MLCSNLNIPSLIVELEAKSMVDIFCRASYVNDVISPILDDCGMLITKFQQVQFRHCFRHANQCADALARIGADQDLEFRTFESPPVDVFDLFEQDNNGLFLTGCVLILFCFLSFNEFIPFTKKKKKKERKLYI